MTRPLTLIPPAPAVPSSAPEGEQWLYTAVSLLITKVQRLERKVADLEGRERI